MTEYQGPERRSPDRKPLPGVQQHALQAARAAGGLWHWRGGYWLPGQPPSPKASPSAGDLEGGWFTASTVLALERRGLLYVMRDGHRTALLATPCLTPAFK